MMVARLLITLVESDAESSMDGDILRARRLATLLGEAPEIIAALSQTLIEPPPTKEVPHVEVALGPWSAMRAQLVGCGTS